MPTTRRPVRSILFRSSTTSVADRRFPRALDGEPYSMYAQATWRQAQLWIGRHWSQVTAGHVTMRDARASLRSIAIMEVGRLLNTQEENMLTAILDDTWTARGNDLPDILPYWSRTAPRPFTPPPAA